jgi:heme oxygenase
VVETRSHTAARTGLASLACSPAATAYRARPDRLPVDGPGREQILEEVTVAFELNAAVFGELAPV